MTFLNLEKKAYIVGDVEYPVRESVKGSELKILRDMQKEIIAKDKSGKGFGEYDELDYEIKLFETVSKVAFGKTYEELLEEISEPDARELLGEAYIFLTKLGTIERAKQLDNVLAEIQEKSSKLSKTTQNSKNSSQSSTVSTQV